MKVVRTMRRERLGITTYNKSTIKKEGRTRKRA